MSTGNSSRAKTYTHAMVSATADCPAHKRPVRMTGHATGAKSGQKIRITGRCPEGHDVVCDDYPLP